MAQKKNGSRKSGAKKTTATRRRAQGSGFPWWRLFRFCLVSGIIVFVALMSWLLVGLPDTDQVKPLEQKPSIAVLAADGTLIARYGGLRGDIVDVKKLPKHVTQAVLAIEDRRFYDHVGIDPWGLLRAFYVNARERRWVQGGSTITQQLAKNLFLTPDKTLRRKGQEAILALVIEYRFDKDDIFGAYLNRVYYGAGAYGIDSAARTYFGKTAETLTLWEGAMLAGLLKAPSRYAPTTNPALARERTEVVIRSMEDAGYIDAKRAEAEIKKGASQRMVERAGNLDRYFADWIIGQIDSFVVHNDRDIVVRTTLNTGLQKLAEEQMKSRFTGIKPEEKISQAAIVTMSRDGAVLAMVGGRDYGQSQFNRATQAMRQPGSAFKPFVMLGALESGYSKNDVVFDGPIEEGSYRPKNYEDKYYGDVTVEDALALSMNTATIRLLDSIGMSKFLDVLTRLGFTHKFKPELATGLGAGETTLLELTNAYAMISNGGHAIWPYAVLSIEDTEGNVLYRFTQVSPARLFSGRDISELDAMLVQVVARGTGQAAQLSRGHVAGKTGTSQNYRDAWFVGYTDRLVTGVWMGNDDNSPMERISGGRYPARLWRDYMDPALGVEVPVYMTGYNENRGGFFSSSNEGFSSLLKRLTGGGTSHPPGRNDNRPAYNR